MKKLNEIVYNKLLLQAEEAKEQGFVKLASGVFGSLGPVPEDEACKYNSEQLGEDVYNGLWKLAACVIKYHDTDSVDAQKVHEVLEMLASKLIEQIETSLGIDNAKVGPLEEKIPGEV